MRLLALGFLVAFVGTFSGAVNAATATSISSTHDYNKVQTYIRALADQYRDTATLIEVGQSSTGESIVGLKIGNGPVHNLIVATHHGNEYGSTEVALGAAAEFAKNPIANQTIYIIPVLNVSGFNANRREETWPEGGAGVTADPNRDYPGACATEGPFRLKSTKALADLIDRENIVASATLHTFDPAVLYPWGIATHDTSTPYDSIFIDLAKASVVESQYAIGNSTEMLYPADGAYEDYAFWKHGIWSLLFEVGTTHSPNESQLAELVKVNVPGLRRMMETAPTERAVDHEFHGKCDTRLSFIRDRHDE